jgi:hypothetical protein
MQKHVDINGLSPQEAHDKLRSQVSPEAYDQINKKAKFAAEDLRKRVGGKIANVHWSSKPGDIKRTTGIESSQKEDPSDIIVTTNDGRHHGISLKTSENTEHVPIANPGAEALHGADHILAMHRENIKQNFPSIAQQTNARGRKDVVRADPEMQANVRALNRQTLAAMSQHLHKKLSEMPPEELVHHLRSNVLHAHTTPMQEQGHNHLRHTVWGSGDKLQAKAIDPGSHYEDILRSPQHITVQNTGQGVAFLHKGVPFARQNVKFDSQDDPLSSVKSATQDIGLKKPKVEKQPKAKKVKLPVSGEHAGVKFNSSEGM